MLSVIRQSMNIFNCFNRYPAKYLVITKNYLEECKQEFLKDKNCFSATRQQIDVSCQLFGLKIVVDNRADGFEFFDCIEDLEKSYPKIKQEEIMKKSQVDYAERSAKDIFDDWNEVTGFVQPCVSNYDEFMSVIEDAVHIGIQMALFGEIKRNEDGEIVRTFSEKEIEND
jgi:hypothetical protein